jgi:hypothetical protein
VTAMLLTPLSIAARCDRSAGAGPFLPPMLGLSSGEIPRCTNQAPERGAMKVRNSYETRTTVQRGPSSGRRCRSNHGRAVMTAQSEPGTAVSDEWSETSV